MVDGMPLLCSSIHLAGYGLQQQSAWGHNSCAGGANDMCGAESDVDTIPAMFGKDNARGSDCARQLPVSWAKIVGKRKEKGETVIKVAAKRAIPRPAEQNRGPGQPRCSSMNPALHQVSGVSPSKSGVLAAYCCEGAFWVWVISVLAVISDLG
ncbi:hypothetical protein U1Q18_025630 [Sarracenia purpurea var. burkii]